MLSKVITIDGPSPGKGTLAKLLSKQINLIYLTVVPFIAHLLFLLTKD